MWSMSKVASADEGIPDEAEAPELYTEEAGGGVGGVATDRIHVDEAEVTEAALHDAASTGGEAEEESTPDEARAEDVQHLVDTVLVTLGLDPELSTQLAAAARHHPALWSAISDAMATLVMLTHHAAYVEQEQPAAMADHRVAHNFIVAHKAYVSAMVLALCGQDGLALPEGFVRSDEAIALLRKQADMHDSHLQCFMDAALQDMHDDHLKHLDATLSEVLAYEERMLREHYEELLDQHVEGMSAYYASKSELDTEAAKLVAQQEVTKLQAERFAVLRSLQEHVLAQTELLRGYTEHAHSTLDLHRLSLAVMRFTEAVSSGRSCATEAQRVRALTADPLVHAVLDSLPASALERGLVPENVLVAQWPKLAQEARRWAWVPEGRGVAWYWAAALVDLLVQPETGLVSGDEPEQVLARAEYHLLHGDMRSAVQETTALPPRVQVVLSEWSGSAHDRLVALQAAQALQAHVQATVSSLEHTKVE